MPRVTHVISTPDAPGGAEVVLRQLIEGLARRGWEQQVLNPFAPASQRDHLVPSGVDARYSWYAARSVARLPRLRNWMRREMRSFQPRLVHGHLFHAAVALASIPRYSEERRVLTHHHGDLFAMQHRHADSALDRWAVSRVDHVVAVSAVVRDFLVNAYGSPAANTSIIRNAWDERFGRIQPNYASEEILCVANLRKEKSIDLLLHAFASVVAGVSRAHLTIVGAGPLRGELQALARDLHLDDRVTFAGFVTNIEPYLEKASLFCLPSSYETLGIAIMEAMAAGLPVVATRVGGVSELVEHGSTGYLVDPGDVTALAQRLSSLLASAGLRARLGGAAKAAVAPYSKQTMVDAYVELYDSLLKAES